MIAARRSYPLIVFFASVALLLMAVSLVAATEGSAAPGDRLWVRAQGGSALVEEFRDLVAGPRGSVYAVGVARGTEESGRLLVSRYDRDGSRLWTRVYAAGGDGAFGLRAVAVPGGIVVAGSAGNPASPHGRDILIVKYSQRGERLWSTRYDGKRHRDDYPADIDLGGQDLGAYGSVVYVGGTSIGKGTGRDYVTLQLNARTGWIIWTKRYDGPSTRDELRALHADAEGNVYVTGESVDARGGSTAAATLAYDIVGQRLWLRRLHAGVGPASGAGISIDIEEQGVYVAGSAVGGMSTGRELMLAKLSLSAGARQWVQMTGVPDGDEETLAFAASGVHGFALAGSTTDRVTGDARALVALWAVDGTPLWQHTYTVGLPGNDAMFTAVQRDGAGNVYLGGFTSGSGHAEDFTVLKYDAAGALQWDDVYDGAAHGTDLCRDLLVRGSGLYAAGLRSKTMLDTSALLIKFER
jgi:hypothetical protein